MAVRIGARDIVAGKQARAAGTVLDHDWLTERVPDRGLQHPGGDIHVSARCIRHHHGDGLRRKLLRGGWLRQDGQEQGAENKTQAMHGHPSSIFLPLSYAELKRTAR
jgi:hypothetical protein